MTADNHTKHKQSDDEFNKAKADVEAKEQMLKQRLAELNTYVEENITNFIERLTMGGGALATSSLMGFSVPENQQTKRIKREESDQKLTADVVIIS